MSNILKDIKSGALPAREIPTFLIWLIGRSFWFWVAATLILLELLLLK